MAGQRCDGIGLRVQLRNVLPEQSLVGGCNVSWREGCGFPWVFVSGRCEGAAPHGAKAGGLAASPVRVARTVTRCRCSLQLPQRSGAW